MFYARAQVGGIERRQSLKTRDPKEAQRRLKQWLENLSPYHGTIRHSFEQAAALWFEAGQWKPKTLKRYALSLTIISKWFGGLYWDQVDKARLLVFMRQRREQGASIATINRDLSVISGIANHVKELPDWPDSNPVESLPKRQRKAVKWDYVRPSSENVEEIFARMFGTFGDLCRLALLTGARMDELASLKREDARNGKLQLWQTKSKFRVILLSPDASAIVDRQPDHSSGYLFVTRNGDRYKRVTEMWREVVKRAQMSAQKDGRHFTRMRFHDLRHEYAIRYLESGGSLFTLQKNLGHGSVTQTEAYLRYLTPDAQERAIQA